MNVLAISVRFVAGIALGLFFYGGLWLTVRQLQSPGTRPGSPSEVSGCDPPPWSPGFLLVMNQRWEYALVCLAGFTAGRLALSKIMPPGRTAS